MTETIPQAAGGPVAQSRQISARQRKVPFLSLAASAAAEAPSTRGELMAYGVVHRFAGGTKEQYEASIAAVHPDSGKRLPEGQVFHAAGPSAEGWVIIAVHESRESWERYRDGTLFPRFSEGIPGGFTTPPEETGFEVYTQQTG